MLQTPAYVDRMELPDDAEGRVAVFRVDDGVEDQAAPFPPAHDGGGLYRRLGAGLDSQYAPVVLAMALVLVLLLGLVLLRR